MDILYIEYIYITFFRPFSPALIFCPVHVVSKGGFQQFVPRGFTPLNRTLLDLEIFVTLQIIL
jgi:hypothetical protein